MTLLVSTDFEGLVIRPRKRIAMLREEFAGRLEVLADDGSLSHRPGPLQDFRGAPFVQAAPDLLVNPAHVRPGDGVLHLPGGWSVPGSLSQAPPEPPPPDDPLLPGGVRASEVLYCEGGGPATAHWVTDRGRIPVPGIKSGVILARFHPQLWRVSAACHANPLRLRGLRRVLGQNRVMLCFDEGTALTLHIPAALRVAENLGAAQYDWIGTEDEVQRELRVLGVRRWPFPLAGASGEFLEREFPGQPGRLLANLALATVEAQARGERLADGHRSWFYLVARPALERAGHMRPGKAPAELPALAHAVAPAGRRNRPAEYRTFGFRPPLDNRQLWLMLCAVWAHLVGGLRLFTYREAGFQDTKPKNRRIGTSHPGLVLLVEKDALRERAFALAEKYGVTVLVTGGVPPLIAAEVLVEELKARAVTRVRIVSYCDFDVVGWEMPEMLAEQLARYGLPTVAIRRIVTPDRFTADELARLSIPLPSRGGANWRSRVDRFMAESGGLGGKRRGIQADHLFPLERVEAAFLALVRDWLEAPPEGRK